jgi:amino acid transporter
MGRAGVMPKKLATTNDAGAPQMASIVTSAIAGLVIVIFAAGGLDPYTKLFSWMSGIAVIAIVAIEILVSLAVLAYFSKQPGENLWKTKVAPVASIVPLAGTVAADVDPTVPESAWKLSSLGWFLVLSPFIAMVTALIVASLSKSKSEALTRDFS